MRPTDFCHLNDLRAPVPSCVPSSLRDFHRVETAIFRRRSFRLSRSLGSERFDRGTECFTTLENASADPDSDTLA